MRKSILFTFVLFFITEYFLRTFINDFKYHEVSFLVESLPLLLNSIIAGLVNIKIVGSRKFSAIFIPQFVAACLGLIIGKAILFIQWYWIIAPEYRAVEGDMDIGLSWLVFKSIVDFIKIGFTLLITLNLIKLFKQNNKSAFK